MAPSALPTASSAGWKSGSVLPTVIAFRRSQALRVSRSAVWARGRSASSRPLPSRSPAARRSTTGASWSIETAVELVVAVGDPPGPLPRAGRAAREPVRSVERPAQPVLETAEALPDLAVAAGDPLPAVARPQRAVVELLRADRRAAQPAAQLGDAVRRPAQPALELGELRPALVHLLLGAFELPREPPHRGRLLRDLVRAHDELRVGNPLQPPLEPADLRDSLRVEQRPVRGPENDVDLRAEAGFPDREVILEHLVVGRQLARVGRDHVAREREHRRRHDQRKGGDAQRRQQRTARDAAHDDVDHAGLAGLGSGRATDPERVDPVPGEAHDAGRDQHRGDHAQDRHDPGADRRRQQDRPRREDDHHQHHRQQHEAREGSRAAGGVRGQRRRLTAPTGPRPAPRGNG